MSIKSDFLKHIKHVNSSIKCAIINFNYSDDKKIILPINYHKVIDRYYDFTLGLDGNYDDLSLHGTIWFEDGSWSKYTESDYGEGWVNYSIPSIPTELL